MNTADIECIVKKYEGQRGSLISILEEVQDKYSYLPEEALRIVAEKTGSLLSDVYGVATFYKWFSLKPRGRHLVQCCVGTACHVRNAPAIVESFEQQLNVKPGETTEDREFTLETVNCLGACALGPVVVTDGRYFPHMNPGKAGEVLKRTQEGLDAVDIKDGLKTFPVEVSCPRCNHSLMNPKRLVDDAPSIKVTIAFNQTHGWLCLSSIYGSYNIESSAEIPMETVVDFFCPHCNSELRGAADCAECGAPMVPMIVRSGGMVQICSRRGCKAHMLDLDGVNF